MSAVAIDPQAARRHAEDVVKQSGTSFAAGMSILPKQRRDAMHAIYAFCREVDDIADDDGLSRDARIAGLAGWRAEIDRLYAGAPDYPTGVALLGPVRAFGLDRDEFLAMIAGMETDANGPVVAPSMEELFAYTRRVAGSVGMLSMPVFGAPKNEAATRFALSLGDALQLTNILRDVGEDAAIGRLYLPADLLDKYGAPKDPAKIVGADGLANVARDLGAIAEHKFADARAALRSFDWRTVRPALLMMGVYEAYLHKLKSRGWERTGESLSLPKLQKLLITARYAIAPPLKTPPA
ncbi:MAG: presqualene diphosphate synthase HpnD [Parvularculaceae bacterium]|nr:presqualene diphosphate synthase HpnD [Parvularculaceae bacterium]